MCRIGATWILVVILGVLPAWRAPALVDDFTWPRAEPASVGLDPAAVALADTYLARQLPSVRAFLVVRDGRLVHESYVGPGEPDQIRPVYSITKSVVSLLAGIARARGEFPSLDARLGDLFAPFYAEGGEPSTAEVRVRHLLTMTSGQRWSETGEAMYRWMFSRNRYRVGLGTPVTERPGTVFSYNTTLTELLGVIVADGTRRSLKELADTSLFGPLGITDYRWQLRASDYYNAGSGLSMKPTDMARIGQLVADGGVWHGRRLVPADWLEAATEAQVAIARDYGYGYQWWVRDVAGCRSFRAVGHGGQYITVVPEKRLVMVVASIPDQLGHNPGDIRRLFEIVAQGADGACDSTLTYAARHAGQAPVAGDSFERLPAELRPLFRGFVEAVASRDLERVMSFYSDRFRLGGDGKLQRRAFWSRAIAGPPSFGYAFDQVDRVSDDLYAVHGWTIIGGSPRPLSVHVIREDGGWRFLGERYAGTARPAMPADLDGFLQRFQAAVGAGEFDGFSASISENYLSNGYSKRDLQALWRENGPAVAGIRFDVRAFEATAAGYKVFGYLDVPGVGAVPMEQLYGDIAREGDDLRWIGNRRRNP